MWVKAFAWRMMGAVLFSALLAAGLSWFPVLFRQQGVVPENVTVFQPRTAVILGKDNLVDFMLQQSWQFRLKKVELNEHLLHLEMEVQNLKTFKTHQFEEMKRIIHQVFAKTQNIQQVRLLVDAYETRFLIEATRSDWRKVQAQKEKNRSTEEEIRENYQVTEIPIEPYGK